MSDRMSESVSERMPEFKSDRMSEIISETMSDFMSNRMLKLLSDRISESSYKRAKFMPDKTECQKVSVSNRRLEFMSDRRIYICQIECQSLPDRMSEFMSNRMSGYMSSWNCLPPPYTPLPPQEYLLRPC